MEQSTHLDNILIVEDEPLIAEDIVDTLKAGGYGVAGVAHNADDAIRILKSQTPSLALLDINIDGHINGLMLAQIINSDFNIPFIFLTSFTDDKTLARVKELRPYGFIVKPFDDKELVTNIELAIAKFKNESQQLASFENSQDKSFFLKQDGSLIKVDVDDILYAEAFDNYCFIHTLSKKYLLPHTLKAVEAKLSPERFIRVHRSFLVNLKAVAIINEDHLIIDGKCISVSKSSRQELMKRISLL